MFKILNKRIRRLCSRLRWPIRIRPKTRIVTKTFGKSTSKAHTGTRNDHIINGSATVHPNGNHLSGLKPEKAIIRVATFNAALFSMAPAVLKTGNSTSFDFDNGDFDKPRRSLDVKLRTKSANDRPKSILKQSPLHTNSINGTDNLAKQQKYVKSKLRVSINLPDNEISLLHNSRLSSTGDEKDEKEGTPGSTTIGRVLRGKAPLRSSVSFSQSMGNGNGFIIDGERYRSNRTVLQVLKELDADVLALQDVKAEEEKDMQPLSYLAAALGMNYVFAESWAPEYGNAVLSKWPIKKWKVQKICDETDFRLVLFAFTIFMMHFKILCVNFYNINYYFYILVLN
ncbi:Exo_endo_phos domain-containing protein [Cephalotus follicularis]|uniref:Exo_endo_phos domain-containing protein n=1 Tax=Cephalotus follicularis TaxID=3775 RepID=A0A1Q3CK49_CEPFO|nr:Exo_endo_phos domain-containing protein [Cephalotus follicularis]